MGDVGVTAASDDGSAVEAVKGVDVDRLARWMDEQRMPGVGEPLKLTRLSGGPQNTAQNALFEVCRGEHQMVLRRPPELNPPSWRCEALLREYRLLRALADTDVPHAKVLGGSDDSDLIGAPFFVMERVDGWNPASGGWQPPFDTDLQARSGLGLQLVDGIARLARVDWEARGLNSFGQPDGFHARQVDHWLGYYGGFQFRELPGLAAAGDWLARHRPAVYEPGIMHSDYRWANVLFGHGQPARLAAIIDWELAAIGDPLLDLGRCLIAWSPEGADMECMRSYEDYEGMPSREQMLEHYEAVSGRPTNEIDYYVVLARFKLAILLEHGYAQFAGGEAGYEIAESFGPLVLELARKAGELAATAKVSAWPR
jgi:aminoglycoside phosphotransferase (APT) family kinase protein